MKKKLLFIVAILFFAISNTTFSQTADDVITKYIEAIGGKDYIRNLKSLSIESKGEMSGIEFVIREATINAEAYKYEMDFGQALLINFFSKKGGWVSNPLKGSADAVDKTKEENEAGIIKMYIGSPFINYKDFGYTVKLEGEENVGDKVTLKVKMIDANNVAATYYFEKSIGFLIKSITREESMGQIVDCVTMFSDYRKVDNISLPYLKVVNKGGTFDISTKVKNVEINKSFNNDFYTKPGIIPAISKKIVAELKTYKPLYDNIAPVCSPEDLYKIDLPNTTIVSVKVEPENNVCMVTANVTHPPHIDKVVVNVALPLTDWNGRFTGLGGGGFTGGTVYSLYLPSAQGFAAASTDGGHPGMSGSFAYDKEKKRPDWQSIKNFSHQAIHDMTVVGKAVVQKFYGKPAKYSYFQGGSNGGRQAMESVQRFPDDYDGVTALCPALFWNRFLFDFLWPTAVMNDANNYVSKEKLIAVTEAVIAACDGDDGVVDGVIDDPINCTWDPKEFVGTKVGKDVFTTADADVVRKIWDGPRGYDNKFLWYGPTRGTNLTAFADTKGEPLEPNPNSIGVEWVKYFLISDPDWDGKSLSGEEFERLFSQSVDQYATLYSTSKTDLTVFRDKGKKLIMTHGLADNMIPPQGSIKYYKNLQENMGGAKATSKFARLFLFPGLDHGFAGPGEKPVDVFDAIINWIEEGKAPEYIKAELKDDTGEVIRRKSIYPFKE